MTEPAVQDLIVRPSRARPHRVKSPQEIAWEKRVSRVVGKFLVEAMRPTIREIGVMFAEAKRENLALQHRLAALENDNADRAAIVKLKEKLATVEATLANSMSYEGVWERGRFYKRGAAVTCDGGLWLCVAPTELRPGSGNSWRLTVKSGSMR